MTVLKKRVAVLALGLAAIALASPSYAHGAGHDIGAARAAAIHECSLLAEQYPENDWGMTEIYQYRACMAEHGQEE